jgi:hypothetical protein
MVQNKDVLKIIIPVFLFVLFFWTLSRKWDKKEKNFQFRGVIEKIDYDINKIPDVTVNGNTYHIFTGRRFNEKMNVGDSIIKEKGSWTYKLIKYKSGEVVISK